jgi:long-chain acyl-CoA synthetase
MQLKKLTLAELISHSAEIYAQKQAVSFIDTDFYTYKELNERSLALSGWLKDQGIGEGDRVALLSSNMPNWVLVYFAVSRMKAVIVPILPDFSAEDVVNILNHAEVKAIFVSEKLDQKLKTFSDTSIIKVILDKLPIDLEPYLGKSSEELSLSIPEEEDLASIIYTSGTTGHSKGVMLSHRNLVFDALATSPIPGFSPGDKMLSILPLSHTYECTIGMLIPLMMGSHIHYLDKLPSPSVLLPALQKVKPDLMLSVPLLIEKIYRQSVLPSLKKKALVNILYKLPPFRRFFNRIAGKKLMKTFGGKLYFFGIGGAALAPDVEKFLREAKFPYAIGYGLTETSPLIAGCHPSIVKERSTGLVLHGVTVKIDTPDPDTGEGEILVKGPNVMLGYYKDEERTAEVFTDDGWFKTGDLGVMDEDNYLYIRGRSKNMILGPSGENIYPESIEAIINHFDYVNESLVFEEGGKIFAKVHFDTDRIKEAFSHLTDSAGDISHHIGDYLKDLKKMVNKRLSSFSKVSDIIVEDEPFEKTPTKKIKRYKYLKNSKDEHGTAGTADK